MEGPDLVDCALKGVAYLLILYISHVHFTIFVISVLRFILSGINKKGLWFSGLIS